MNHSSFLILLIVWLIEYQSLEMVEHVYPTNGLGHKAHADCLVEKTTTRMVYKIPNASRAGHVIVRCEGTLLAI